MTKFTLTFDTGTEDISEKKIINEISESLDEGEVDINEVEEVTGRTHSIYSEGEVPCRIYYRFDGYEDLEYSHIKRKTTHYGDEVISKPLQDGFLSCTCGDLNLASREEALEHLEKNSATGLETLDPQIKVSKFDKWTVFRQGKTSNTRRPEEYIHLDDSEEELVTFVPARAESDEEAIEQALSNVMFPDEWDKTEIIHQEGDKIYLVRLAGDGSLDELEVTEADSEEPSYERGIRNFPENEMVTFVSVCGTSPNSALEKGRNMMDMLGQDRAEIIHTESHIYVVRFASDISM